MYMNKLCIAAFGDPRDPKVWSRTPSIVFDYFNQDKELAVETLNMREAGGFIHKISKGFGKIIYRKGTTRDPFLYKILSNRISRYTKKIKADSYLFLAEHCLSGKKYNHAKYYVYLDALLRPYFVYDKRKKKPFSEEFLRLYERNDKESLLQMDGIMTLSQWSKDFLVSEYGIDEKKIHNIGFGINAQYYYGEKDYSNKQMMIVLRSGAEYVKGLPLLLEAFKILHAADPDVRLVVFGTTAERIEGVDYYENCPREFMLETYKTSSLFVLPNILEPLGISYLEAMANKTPIVGLNRWSVPEFTNNGEYGFICPGDSPEDLAHTILDALSDTGRLKEMGIKGQKFVESRYNWNMVLKQIERIVRGL